MAGITRFRMRHLPGSVPLECARAGDERPCVPAALRSRAAAGGPRRAFGRGIPRAVPRYSGHARQARGDAAQCSCGDERVRGGPRMKRALALWALLPALVLGQSALVEDQQAEPGYQHFYNLEFPEALAEFRAEVA